MSEHASGTWVLQHYRVQQVGPNGTLEDVEPVHLPREMQARLLVALTSYRLETGQEPWRLVIDEAGATAPHGQKTYFTPEAAAAKVGMWVQTASRFPIHMWGINSTLFGRHQLNEPPGLHSGGRKPSRRRSQGLQICRVTPIRYGRLNSPLE